MIQTPEFEVNQFNSDNLAIACSVGGFKGAFISGVLQTLCAYGLRAHAYGGASSSVLPTGFALMKDDWGLSVDYWLEGLRYLKEMNCGMSEMVLAGLNLHGYRVGQFISQQGSPRFIIPASFVATSEAAELTQGSGARRLGRKLLLAASKGDRTWKNDNLVLHIFDNWREKNGSEGGNLFPLDGSNFNQVTYASTRVLHAWDIPAWIDDRPYVDAAYTCYCPAVQLAQLGYRAVIVVATEPGVVYNDFFGGDPLPTIWGDARFYFIQPARATEHLGVTFTTATKAGLQALYHHGQACAKRFLEATLSSTDPESEVNQK